ncbi:helix-turn-helix domain-containing protein, partial [Salmonella enterica]|nr:helix-turn-helix domain-containing protein [Salmonella enterica]EJU2690427.1 helix-turn-helix domain-containing protein [Salmonella enterica]EJU5059447.1 helix-turn-helix domain-containing protein [Salmonella enterica]EJX4233266.1 helix-turn-helix domain-containing protein [Salmonella enterica]
HHTLGAQAGCLIGAGVPRQQVAIIYDVGLSTLYRKFPAGENETADIPYATCCG